MQDKLKQIQGIRALAMLGIFLAHTTVWLPERFDAFVPIFLKLGGSGVATFFIISGFLLSFKHRMVPMLPVTKAIQSAWKKVNKMYGLYLITVAVCFVCRLPVSASDWLQKSIFLVFHVTLTQDFVPFAALINAFNAPSWFLSALFGIWIIIYLFPHVVNDMMNLDAKKCAVAIVGIFFVQILWMLFVNHCVATWLPTRYLTWCRNWLVYNNPVLCFSEYCVGVLLGRLCAQRQFSAALQNCLMLLTMISVMVYAVMVLNSIMPPSAYIMVIAECLASVGIIAVISPQSWGNKILSMRPLVRFGNISGYFFLIHTASIFMMRAIADYVPQSWLIFISFMLSILLAICSDYIYGRIGVRKIKTILR